MKRLDFFLVVAILLTIVAVEVARSTIVPSTPHAKPAQEKVQSTQDLLDPKVIEKRLQDNPVLKRRFQIFGFGASLVMVVSLGCLMQWLARFFTGCSENLGARSKIPPWDFGEVARLVLVLVLVSYLVFLIEWLLIHALRLKQPDNHLLTLGNTLLIDLAAFAGACKLFQGKGRPDYFQWGKVWRDLRFGITSYLAFLPLFLLGTILVAAVMQFLKMDPTPQPVFTLFFSENRSVVIGWFFFLVAVAGPVAEELFFRGVLYGWLRSRIGVWKGLAVTALFFSALHGNLMVFLPIFGLGLLFGWVYERTGSLAAPIGIHVLHNGGMLIVASFLKSLA